MSALRLLLLALFPLFAHADEPASVTTVSVVDLPRYLGRWYEIASFPMFFQRRCLGDTTAEYAQPTPDAISVTNRCRTEDGFIEAKGKAKVVPDSGNARLKVTFFWPFSADYWIIGLDPDYRWAVVGHPNRKTLWVLARTPQLAEADWFAARKTAEAQGYDLSALRITPHKLAPTPGKNDAP